MDLIRLLRSLEEFLYELVGWLVFYPRSFWRILRHPAAIARYTALELQQEPGRQFTETISPVLMLILSVVIGHALEMLAKLPLPPSESSTGQLLFGSEQALLLSRCVVFCTYALVAACVTLRRQRTPITRDTLREPFSVQAYLVSPFVVLLSLGTIVFRSNQGTPALAGLAIGIAACGWYVWARVSAYRALVESNLAQALGLVLSGFLGTTAVIVLVVSLAVE